MRIISGSARGSKLLAPIGAETRPTEDMVKESFFNIITNLRELNDCRFLDLFAGSGAIGLEALSRGAREAVFVDHSAKSVAAISKNLEKTRLSAKAKVLKSTAAAAITKLRTATPFDIIYMDPPYESGLCPEIVKLICENGLLAQDGIIAAELSAKEDVTGFNLEIFRTKQYSSAKIIFMTNSGVYI